MITTIVLYGLALIGGLTVCLVLFSVAVGIWMLHICDTVDVEGEWRFEHDGECYVLRKEGDA